jgi:uncharacterized protein (TIGR00645 family)
VNNFFTRLFVGCRLLLVPLFLGLMGALVLLVIFFLGELWQLGTRLLTTKVTETELVISLLALIDLTLIGSLIVIMVYSGYENFVAKIDRSSTAGWPGWMTRVTFHGLKQQFFASLMAISGITLLKALMKLETSVSETQVKWLVVSNIIFVVCYAVLTVTDHFHGSHDDENH